MGKLSFRTKKWEQKIQALDAEKDAEEIVSLLIAHVFSLDIFLSTEMAQLRTFTIPSISKILHHSRQYEHHSLKRMDDTKAILGEMGIEGMDSERGKAATEHLNNIHAFYRITNDDYLYTLSTFIFDPRLWLERFGWRQLTDHEQNALYHRYRKMGEAMHIQDIPDTWQKLWAWRVAYEKTHQQYDPANTQVSLGLLNGASQMVPPLFKGVMSPITISLFDANLEANLGLKKPNLLARGLTRAVMQVYRFAGRFFNLWEEDSFVDSKLMTHMETYPHGYQLWELGPDNLVKHLYPEKFAHPVAEGAD